MALDIAIGARDDRYDVAVVMSAPKDEGPRPALVEPRP